MSSVIWITGAGGLIGSHLANAKSEWPREADVRALTRADLDLLDANSVRAAFERDRPGTIIHCAALSKSPACQADPELAHRLNVEVTRTLADLSDEIPMAFFSSDLVFDGRHGFYDENAAVNPLSVYGETKVLAENIVLSNPRHLVVRTSLNAGVSVGEVGESGLGVLPHEHGGETPGSPERPRIFSPTNSGAQLPRRKPRAPCGS